MEEAGEDADWDNFREKLINAQSTTKSVRIAFSSGRQSDVNSQTRERLAKDHDMLSMTSLTT